MNLFTVLMIVIAVTLIVIAWRQIAGEVGFDRFWQNVASGYWGVFKSGWYRLFAVSAISWTVLAAMTARGYGYTGSIFVFELGYFSPEVAFFVITGPVLAAIVVLLAVAGNRGAS